MPLVVQDRQLIAAIEDPHDFATLEALAQLTGYRVLPRVAPEVRIYYYIERYYGVARPARFVKFGDSPRGDETRRRSGAARAAAARPAARAAPRRSPRPVRARACAARRWRRCSTSRESLELDAEDLIETLDADDAAPAEPRRPCARPSRTTTPPPMARAAPPTGR